MALVSCVCDVGPRAPFDARFWVGLGARGPNMLKKGEPLWKISYRCSYFLYIRKFFYISTSTFASARDSWRAVVKWPTWGIPLAHAKNLSRGAPDLSLRANSLMASFSCLCRAASWSSNSCPSFLGSSLYSNHDVPWILMATSNAAPEAPSTRLKVESSVITARTRAEGIFWRNIL